MDNLITFTDKGLYCPQGDFYIDPWKPVERAVITHGHSDHARAGNDKYLCHPYTKAILELRLGPHFYQTVNWGEKTYINGVEISLHPAGHVVGSSQVRVEYRGDVWVFTGDYKTASDGISGDFQPIPCNTFITESTFGLPIYQWESQEKIYDAIQDWVLANKADNLTSVLIAYSLGKAQRVLDAVKPVTNEVYVHGAIANMQEVMRQLGISFVNIKRITPGTTKEELRGAVVIAPPSADRTPWMKKFPAYRLGICSGWMQVRGNARRRNADKGFVLSDHCDWYGLLDSVKATGAQKVFVTHGFQSAFSKYLNESGIEAAEVTTGYGQEEEETLSGHTDFSEA